ncbi:AzlC family ABC transporter permease [Nocardioides taihuensis]|uniref:AzlC family ABC transporter permease n=1 Tax=Nocardioides taihuensis TaxID=1835606 RepID=A0ABW0BR53_9ACTN
MLPETGTPVGTWSTAVRAASRDLLPFLITLVPFALVVGVTAQQTRVGALGGLAGGFAIYAGTAQLSAMSLLGAGAPVATVVVTVAIINARLPLYAAALERHFRPQPRWFRWVGPHFIVDQTYVLVSARDDLDHPTCFRRYWLSIAAVLSVVWLTSIAAGLVVGHRLPTSSPVLAFAPAALFIPLLVARLTERTSTTAAVAAVVTTAAVHLSGLVPAGLPVLVGAVSGTVAAATMARRTS